MSEAQVILFLEDQLKKGASVNQHGPSLLVWALLADRFEEADGYWNEARFRRQVAIYPCKGDTKVRTNCCTYFERFRNQGQIVAMVDRDKLHRPCKLPPGACRTQLRAAFLMNCPAPDEIELVFLEDNMETILRAAVELLGTSDDLRTLAIDRKDLNARDSILGSLYDPHKRPQRDALLERVPSLARLIDKLCARLEVR